jgi:hypothetical protein
LNRGLAELIAPERHWPELGFDDCLLPVPGDQIALETLPPLSSRLIGADSSDAMLASSKRISLIKAIGGFSLLLFDLQVFSNGVTIINDSAVVEREVRIKIRAHARKVAQSLKISTAIKVEFVVNQREPKAVPIGVSAIVFYGVQEDDQLAQGKWPSGALLRKTKLRFVFVNQAVFDPPPRPSGS